MTYRQPVAVLRVFDIQSEDGSERCCDAHAIAGALQLEPGNYELVLTPSHPEYRSSGERGETAPKPFAHCDCPDCDAAGVAGTLNDQPKEN